MLKFDTTVSGVDSVSRAMRYFERNTRKRPIDGVRVAAAFCAGSLASRTKASKKGAEVRVATADDIRRIAEAHPDKLFMLAGPNAEGYFKNVVRKGHGGALVVKSDRPGRQYVADWWFLRDEHTTSELRKRYAFANRGLAKKSWKWCQSRSKKTPSGSPLPASARGLAGKAFSVYADERSMSVVITNRLGYIRKATAENAVDDSLRAAANKLVGWVNRMVARELERAGFPPGVAQGMARARQ